MGWENSKPTIVMVACQFMYAGVNLSSRAVLLEGMSSRVFVVYRQCFAFLLIVPVAYFSSVTLNQNLYFEGLYLASSSAASALGNLVPAITFVMAYLLGLEKVNVRRWGSIAKISGTTVCVSGAVAMAVFKGPKLLNMEIMPTNSITYHFSGLGSSNSSGHDTWLLGCLFLFGNCCCWSLWLILQVNVSALYPDHLSLTAWLCFLSAAQSGIVTVIVEPRAISWLSTTRFQLICCFCAGLTAAITFFAQTWCIAKRGPVFSAMFNPLCTIIVAILACIFLNEELYTGRYNLSTF
ncbi:nodulin MtN21 /EamA-like transporter family protein, partial [Striga asiatica]